MAGEHDPMVDVARERRLVRLTDGTEGRLIHWPLNGGKATIVIAGVRHRRVPPEDVREVLYEDTARMGGR